MLKSENKNFKKDMKIILNNSANIINKNQTKIMQKREVTTSAVI